MRLVNGAGDGLEGLLIDRYHQHIHVQILSDQWDEHLDKIRDVLNEKFPVQYLIVKSRRGLKLKEEVLIGSDPVTIIEEHGMKFEVNLNDGLNCGLFLDMRQNRWMAGTECEGKKVLNCFAYTCSFGVHARQGKAREVINTDISRKILARGENNYRLNSLPRASGEFIKADSMAYLERAYKKQNNFDVIILDPPSFARHEGQVFQVKRDLPKLITLAVAVLNPGGKLWVSTNYSEINHALLEQMLAAAVKSCQLEGIIRRVSKIKRFGQDADFTGSNTFKESYLAGLWVEFL